MILTIVLVVSVAAYCVAGVAEGFAGTDSAASRWLGVAVEMAAVVICMRAAVRTHFSRWEVALGAAAVTVYAAGDTYYFLSQDEKQLPLYASAVDTVYLAFFVLMLGVFVAMVCRLRSTSWPVLINSIVAALAAVSVEALFLAPILQRSVPEFVTVQGVFGTVYLALTFIMMGALGGAVASRRLDLGPRWPMLVVGLVVVSSTDYADALGIQAVLGSVTDVGWVLGIALIALWVDAASRTNLSTRWWDLRIPESVTAVTSTLLALMVLAISGHSGVPVVAEVLAMMTLALAAIPLVFRNRMLMTLATTDELTGFPNRRALLTDLPPRLQRNGSSALLVMDLDKFKHVNDALGHDVGDALLVQVSRRFSSVLRSDDLLVRLGGDEFAVFLASVSGDEAASIAERLTTVLKTPIEIGDASLQISVSIGIAMAPANGTDLSLLMRKADIAMFRAKENRSGYHAYTSSDRDDGVLRLQTIQELRTAFAKNQFELHYQPKVHLSDRRLAGVEALIRWNHPVRGQLSPGEFLPLVEEAGLLPELSDLVLKRAISCMASWRADGLEVSVAVNLAGSDITDHLVTRIQALLEEHDVPAELLMLEITEDTLMSEPDRAAAVLRELRIRGIRTSIDDFGTGYSSLAYLRDLPVDEIKLDRSFIKDMGRYELSRGLVASIISLVHSLGLRVVAEGVEDVRASEDLRAMGCDLAQGFHYSRPLRSRDVPKWVNAHTIATVLDDPRALTAPDPQ